MLVFLYWDSTIPLPRLSIALNAIACRIFPNGEVQYLHPKDGVYPEKVNAGRQPVGTNDRSIGKNTNPVKVSLLLLSYLLPTGEKEPCFHRKNNKDVSCIINNPRHALPCLERRGWYKNWSEYEDYIV